MVDEILLAPSRSDRPAFRWRTRLDGRFYGFRLVFSQRMRTWLLDLSDATGAPIFTAVTCVVDQDLTRPFAVSTIPPGQLFVRDESGLGRIPGRDAWRSDHRMIYRPEADVAAAVGTDLEVR